MKVKKIALVAFAAFATFTLASVPSMAANTTNAQTIIEPNYYTLLQTWKNQGILAVTTEQRMITPEMMATAAVRIPAQTNGYTQESIHWLDSATIELTVDVANTGLYDLVIDYYPLGSGNTPLQGELKVNGEYQYFEQRNLQFPYQWRNAVDTFSTDERGNEKMPDQVMVETWMQTTLTDAAHLYERPMQIQLQAGMNTLELTNVRGEAYIGNVTVQPTGVAPTYEQYKNMHQGQSQGATLITIEAEQYTQKNQSYLLPQVVNNPSVYPYETGRKLLNALSGQNWLESGQEFTWEFQVPETGLYELSLKVLQNFKSDTSVFRDILIDGELLFSELGSYPFMYDTKWQNVTLSNQDAEPFQFYLTAGSHTITMKANAANFMEANQLLETIKSDIERTTLSIKKLTGNQTDSSRQWDIIEYMPELPAEIASWLNKLEIVYDLLMKYSANGKEYPEVVTLKEIVYKIEEIQKKPNDIPKKLNDLSEGTGSVTQKIVSMTTALQKQPLSLDRFYIHGNAVELEKAEVSFVKKMTNSVQEFFISFTQTETKLNSNDPDVLDVWINRPRQYVDVLQAMIDETFTKATGVQVKLSIMPDESKLILANAANTQPDVALGVSTNLPYELAVRGAAAELTQFEDFYDYVSQFAPGSLMSYIVDDKAYGIPETLDFYVTFYREDIMNELNVPIPNTWDDVLSILPELQRFGMNFYTPLAGAGGFKPFMSTAPYIYQAGGDLYAENGMSTGINSEEAVDGIKFMTDMFSVYSMPLQVGNFYNSFRYGTLPIGVSNFSTYIQLMSAAPEIAGLWDIALHPGMENEAGEIERWATGSAQSAMIFEKSDKQAQGWEFLKWWMDTDTQVTFANKIQNLYGPTYMWNTANLDAFVQLPWDEKAKAIILEQWDWLVEVPKAPGSYMLERELSNVWNEIVFDGANPRAAIDDAVIRIDREFARKLEEFGYLENGEVVQMYKIPTLELVESWVNN